MDANGYVLWKHKWGAAPQTEALHAVGMQAASQALNAAAMVVNSERARRRQAAGAEATASSNSSFVAGDLAGAWGFAPAEGKSSLPVQARRSRSELPPGLLDFLPTQPWSLQHQQVPLKLIVLVWPLALMMCPLAFKTDKASDWA